MTSSFDSEQSYKIPLESTKLNFYRRICAFPKYQLLCIKMCMPSSFELDNVKNLRPGWSQKLRPNLGALKSSLEYCDVSSYRRHLSMLLQKTLESSGAELYNILWRSASAYSYMRGVGNSVHSDCERVRTSNWNRKSTTNHPQALK